MTRVLLVFVLAASACSSKKSPDQEASGKATEPTKPKTKAEGSATAPAYALGTFQVTEFTIDGKKANVSDALRDSFEGDAGITPVFSKLIFRFEDRRAASKLQLVMKSQSGQFWWCQVEVATGVRWESDKLVVPSTATAVARAGVHSRSLTGSETEKTSCNINFREGALGIEKTDAGLRLKRDNVVVELRSDADTLDLEAHTKKLAAQ